MDSNLNPTLCSACGGKCCKRMPGMYSPNDFKEITPELIVGLLDSQKVAIDWWDGDPVTDKVNIDQKSYYLRPRIISEPAIKGSWGGICVNLTETGCSLTEEDKPSQCKSLIPKLDGDKYDCKSPDPQYQKQAMVISWVPYQEQFVKAIEIYRSKEE